MVDETELGDASVAANEIEDPNPIGPGPHVGLPAEPDPVVDPAKPEASAPEAPEAPAPADPPMPDITDAAAKLADEHGIDISEVQGTGAEGRILVKDMEALLPDEPAESEPEPEPAPKPPLKETFMERVARQAAEAAAPKGEKPKKAAPTVKPGTLIRVDEIADLRFVGKDPSIVYYLDHLAQPGKYMLRVFQNKG